MKKEELLNLATLFNGDNIEVIRTLPENSIEHEKLSEMLSSGEIASMLKRNA